jgi:hypothetical protein
LKRWWRATEGIRFVLILLALIVLWIVTVALVRSN